MLTALASCPPSRGSARAPGQDWVDGDVENSSFRLTLLPQNGLEKTRLRHVPSGLLLADGDYSYSFPRPEFSVSRSTEGSDRATQVLLQGTALDGRLEVVQTYRVPRDQPWIEEVLTLTNRSRTVLDLHDGRCGFVLPLFLSESQVGGQWAQFKLTAIPFRREPNGHRTQYADFSLREVLTEQYSSEHWTHQTSTTPFYAAEGWALTDGKMGFLISKHSPKGMEWSLLDRVPLESERLGLRWGGYGIYRGNPEHGAWLQPGESHRFGVTRLTAYSGGWLEGFYTFRAEMERREHGCPQGFNPPCTGTSFTTMGCGGFPMSNRMTRRCEILGHEGGGRQGQSYRVRSALHGSRMGHKLRLENLGRTTAGPVPRVHVDAQAGLQSQVLITHSAVWLV